MCFPLLGGGGSVKWASTNLVIMDLQTKVDDFQVMYGNSFKNSCFDMRLREFDKNLRLLFNNLSKRWEVLEFFPGNEYPKVVLTLEDESGSPKEAGEWVVNKLLVQHVEWKRMADVGVDEWLDDKRSDIKENNEKIEEKSSDEFQYRVKNDIVNFRKINAGLNNQAVSDVMAGYQYTPKQGE